MRLPHRVLRGSTRPRGQALVELAIILPLLALMLVMAIDFGRVFFGWIALENAARIGADHAAAHALAWTNSSPSSLQTRNQYQQLVLDDLESLNCDPDPRGTGDPVPDPVFTNPDGTTTGNVHQSGDHAEVALDCAFGLLTPLAEGIFGGPVSIHAEAIFPVNSGAVLGLPSAPEPPPALCPPPVAAFTTNPGGSAGGRVNGSGSVMVSFIDTSTTTAGCAITAWAWDFNDGPPVVDSTSQNTNHTFTYGGSGGHTDYTVELTVTNTGGSSNQTIVVRVAKP